MKFIAKILALIFLLGSFMPRTDFSQLTHLKDLTDHFQLHIQEAESTGEEISLHQFLLDHFVNPTEHEHQNSDHQQLPLHSCAVSVVMAIAEMPAPSLREMEVRNLVIPSYLDQFHLDEYVLVIDHPPAACAGELLLA